MTDDTLVGDLAEIIVLLGGSETSFKGRLCYLICKADPDNLTRLAYAYPVEVATVHEWQCGKLKTRAQWSTFIDRLQRSMGKPTFDFLLGAEADGVRCMDPTCECTAEVLLNRRAMFTLATLVAKVIGHRGGAPWQRGG